MDEIETKIAKISEAMLPTKFGVFKISVFRTRGETFEHILLSLGKLVEPVLTRVHSQCLTGDTLFSMRCDCGEQLEKSFKLISEKGSGVILYLNQEGRGIGISNKIKAYALQDSGLDTVEANYALGLPIDARDYSISARMLKLEGISEVELLTNNPRKEIGLTSHGIKVVKRKPIKTKPNKINARYLKTKKEKMGHLLSNIR